MFCFNVVGSGLFFKGFCEPVEVCCVGFGFCCFGKGMLCWLLFYCLGGFWKVFACLIFVVLLWYLALRIGLSGG